MNTLPFPTTHNTPKTPQQMWVRDMAAYDKEWPFPPGTRCVTKGPKKQAIEIDISRGRMQWWIQSVEGVVVAFSAHGVLRLLHQLGLMVDTNSNWSYLWFTLDNGATYIRGKELRRYHAAHFAKPLVPVLHEYLPAA